MKEERIEAVLSGMVRRAPEKTVNRMLKTVRSLEKEKLRRASENAPAPYAAAAKARVKKAGELSHGKKPKAPSAGMKK